VEKYCGVGQATDDHIIRRMRFACWITKATDSHSEYEPLIAFPQQEWFREDTSMLRSYTYVYIALCSVLRHVCSYFHTPCFIGSEFSQDPWSKVMREIISFFKKHVQATRDVQITAET
jgi:hypothetical protein